ncbi:MAG: lamin tail domain-containing protein [Flavobacteriales bacterium]|nr:lamin tail domain-containing protein [Flavobacteriales bacterium]
MLKVNRLFLLLLGWIIGTSMLLAQVSDDFSDGDFTNNPVWSGDDVDFEVDGSFMLHLNAPAVSATKYLSTPSVAIENGSWEFIVQITFNPSSSNYTDVYLTSSSADLSSSLNGYFVRIGNSDDDVSLYKQDGLIKTEIIDGQDGILNVNSSLVKVLATRSATGDWVLSADTSAGFTGYNAMGSVTDVDFSTSTYFGVSCTFTSTRSDKFYFDDINVTGTAPVDNTPPTVSSVSVVSSTQLSILFDEPVDVTTAETEANYSANNGLGNPSSAVVNVGNPAQVDLTFSTAFSQGVTNTLTVSNVEDVVGNVMISSDHDFLYFVPVSASFGDILFNEIFADPSPQYGLPAAEYVELYNASNNIYNLSGWVFSDASSSATLPNYFLMPGEVVAIADDDYTFDFSIFPNIIFVTSLPSLNNASDDIYLEDDLGTMIDSVSYSDAWYQDAVKDDGGYSLELINPELPCSGAANWIASNNSDGGTPGTQNSVFDTSPDVIAPEISSSNVLNLYDFEICFSESIDTAGITTGNFSMNNGNSIAQMNWSADLTCVELTTVSNLDTGTIYTVTIVGMVDCSGNSGTLIADIVLPATAVIGDLIINEILFNPYTGGDDFVEIYNNSEKYIDLYGMYLANWDEGVIDNYKEILVHRLVSPGEFIVLTKDSADIKFNYLNAVVGSFVQLSTLPTYANDSGSVYLVLPDSSISDQFSYDEDMHYPLIKNPDGVSLERIDYNRESSDVTNWHSGAENAGWATPGKENSQYYPGMISEDMVSLSPDVFSPDNDGVDDVLNISYSLDGPGYVGNITIFDREGRLVKYLLQSELLATEGIISWDGTNNNLEKAPIGVYVIYFEVFDLEGNVSGVKKSTVLAGKF